MSNTPEEMDAKIRAAGSYLIQKHIGAMKELAKGEAPKAWKVGRWGAHICPCCGFGEKGEEYIGQPYNFCPNCGEPLDKPNYD